MRSNRHSQKPAKQGESPVTATDPDLAGARGKTEIADQPENPQITRHGARSAGAEQLRKAEEKKHAP